MSQALLAPSPAPILTSQDVMSLLQDDSSFAREAILEKVVLHYNDNSFAPRERQVAEHIFRLLMKDVVVGVRETLAERIKSNDQIPRDIILHLAQDVTSVAVPILAASQVLSDADLVQIVDSSRDMSKLVAISRRDTVSPRVSSALIDTSYAQVIAALLANDGAHISEKSYSKLVDNFDGDSTVAQALIQRHQLPVAIVERLIATASKTISDQLAKKYKLNAAEIRNNAIVAREDCMLRLLDGELPIADIEELVLQMETEGRLTHSLAMTALCRGQLNFFTIALARFAKIPASNALRLVSDRGMYGFAGLYDKAHFPPAMYDAILLLLRATQELEKDAAIPGSLTYANRLAERVLAAAGNEPIEYLPYFLALIRQNTHLAASAA